MLSRRLRHAPSGRRSTRPAARRRGSSASGSPTATSPTARRRSSTRRSASPPSGSPSASAPRSIGRARRSPSGSRRLAAPVTADGSQWSRAKQRLDALLAERGLFESRSRAAAAVLAGEVRIGADGARAPSPASSCADDVELARRRGPALRLARRHQARQRARRERARGRRPPLPRRRRLDRRLHRLPARSGRRARRRARRRLRRAQLAAARRPARDRDRAHQRAQPEPATLPYAPELIVVDVSFISLRTVLPAVLALRRAALRRAGAGQAAVRGRPRPRRRGRRRARRRRCGARALLDVARGRARARRLGARLPLAPGCPGPKGNHRDLHRAGRGAPGGSRRRARGAARCEADRG